MSMHTFLPPTETHALHTAKMTTPNLIQLLHLTQSPVSLGDVQPFPSHPDVPSNGLVIYKPKMIYLRLYAI